MSDHRFADAAADARPTTTSTVLLYSDDPLIRDRMRLAVGPRPAPEFAVRFLEASSWQEVRRVLDANDVDLVLLDGEAAPAGGIGVARQIKDEVVDAPPTCVVLARAADRWLAAYALVDATVMFPMDPVTTARTVAGLLRDRANAVPVNR